MTVTSNLEFTTFLDDFKYPEKNQFRITLAFKNNFTSAASTIGWHTIGSHYIFVFDEKYIILYLFGAGTKERTGSQFLENNFCRNLATRTQTAGLDMTDTV